MKEKSSFIDLITSQTPGFFIKDTIKKYCVGMLISLPLVAAVIFIVQSGGDYFFLYLWLFVTLVIVLLMTVYPDYIAPLFDKYSPLPEGELKSQIEKLAASIEFPLKKLYVVEGRGVHKLVMFLNDFSFSFFRFQTFIA